MIKGILFDLDGTLADTAPDLAHALNETLKHYNKAELPFNKIRPVVSHGGRALIELGFGIGPDNESYESIRQHLLNVYLENIAMHTTLFPGMEELLLTIESNNLVWGVVTNKPGWLTIPLMDALKLSHRAACIVSGDTTARSKPHPEPIFYGCKQAQLEPRNCLYVGDAERDIEAGKAAGMKTIAALFGYIQEQDIPEEWAADYYINHPAEILSIILP